MNMGETVQKRVTLADCSIISQAICSEERVEVRQCGATPCSNDENVSIKRII